MGGMPSTTSSCSRGAGRHARSIHGQHSLARPVLPFARSACPKPRPKILFPSLPAFPSFPSIPPLED